MKWIPRLGFASLGTTPSKSSRPTCPERNRGKTVARIEGSLRRLTRTLNPTVLVFGGVSLLTDVSSEMIYPLLPLFLTSVLGAGPAFIGLIEGAAESTAAFLKLLSGVWSDRVKDRTKLVLAGYSLSSCSRPLIAAASTPAMVLMIRCADRIGKGLRTSPRDAMIADAVTPANRGIAYGFHRSMDNAGAVIGPFVATLLLAHGMRDLRLLFWLAAIPGILAVVLVLAGVREVRASRSNAPRDRARLVEFPRGMLRRYLFVLLLFTLGNSSDAFLLLRAGQLGISAAELPMVWIVFHLVKMVGTWPCGAWSDRIGRRGLMIAGWAIYSVTYLGFAWAHAPWQAWSLFALYGLFYGFTEGTERALLADLSSVQQRGQAFGWYHGLVGIAALPASLLFGFIWQQVSPQAAFVCGASLAAIATVLLLWLVHPASSESSASAR